MKGKNIVRTLALAVVAAFVLIAPLQAASGCLQPAGPGKKMMGRGWGMGAGCMMLAQIPGLSAEQKTKIEALRLEHQKDMIGLRAELAKKRLELRTLLKDPVDVKKAEAKIDELARFHAGLQKKCLAQRQAVRALLTDEQKAKIADMDCGMRMASMHGMGCRQGQAQAGKGCGHRYGQDKAGCAAKPECQAGAEKKTP